VVAAVAGADEAEAGAVAVAAAAAAAAAAVVGEASAPTAHWCAHLCARARWHAPTDDAHTS
jgi:hypothetical protein